MSQPADVKVYVSDSNKDPGEGTSQFVFVNPNGKFMIRKIVQPILNEKKLPKDKKEEKKDKNLDVVFECASIYIAFYSSAGCHLHL
jgi:hypothetical protein